MTSPDGLKGVVDEALRTPATQVHGRLVEVPVVYDGPDLESVAARAGMPASAVADRHAAVEYHVFMLGFLPGFAYMGSVDPAIAAPRHATPRLRVPAGSVGIAGRQTGIYPCESPGGWQIIGRTAMPLFDPQREPSATLAPGDRVRFVRETGIGAPAEPAGATPAGWRGKAERVAARALQEPAITVLSPGLFTTVQDSGRWGHQAVGVSVAGALDQAAYRCANRLVGNPPGAAALEVTIGGPELRFERPAIVAIVGADLSATLDHVSIELDRPLECPPGSVLRFGARRRGARAYIAMSGGIDVPAVLGSRSTHALTRLGGRPLSAGDRLGVGPGLGIGAGPCKGRPMAGGRTTLRVLPGPQDESFAPGALDLLQQARFQVSPQSNRMGYRLSGAVLPPPRHEMISDATFTGAIQVPPAGEPILLMGDRQTVGGYPQMATVISADIPLAAQLAPGDWVEFALCTRDEAIRALRDQEAWLAG